MASEETIAAYRTEALKKTRRAVALYPELRELEALFRYVRNYPNALAPNTVRLWRQQLRIAVADIAKPDPRAFSERQINEFMLSMDEAVDALRGRPNPKRT